MGSKQNGGRKSRFEQWRKSTKTETSKCSATTKKNGIKRKRTIEAEVTKEDKTQVELVTDCPLNSHASLTARGQATLPRATKSALSRLPVALSVTFTSRSKALSRSAVTVVSYVIRHEHRNIILNMPLGTKLSGVRNESLDL